MLEICGYNLDPGTKKQVVLRVNVNGQAHEGKVGTVPDSVFSGEDDGSYEMPATLICGSSTGKTLLVTAGMHGGEWNGIPAVIRAAAAIDPKKVSGNIILIHCVNTSGFRTKVNGLLPEDGFNLNGDYPGKPDGTVGERLADYFVKNIFPNVDFVMDLHGGGYGEIMAPLLFYPYNEKVTDAAFEAAKALDVEYLVESHASTGEVSYAAGHFDIPGLLVELGYSCICRPEWTKKKKKNIYLLLNHLGIYEKDGLDPADIAPKTVSHKNIYLSSDREGLWYPHIELGSEVSKGDILGHIEDLYGNVLTEYAAEDDAVVLYYTSALSVAEGEALIAYGLKSGIC